MANREVIIADETETLDIELSKDLLDENRRLAAQLRKTFDENGIAVIDVMGSIGAGKTSLIENLVKTLAALNVKHITTSTYKAKPDNWNRVRQAFPETASKLEPLYFEKGEKIGGYRYLPKELRYNLMKSAKDLTEVAGMTFGTCREGLAQLNTSTCDGAEYCRYAH